MIAADLLNWAAILAGLSLMCFGAAWLEMVRCWPGRSGLLMLLGAFVGGAAVVLVVVGACLT